MPARPTNASSRKFSISPVLGESSEVESNPEGVVAKGYGLSTGLAGQPNIFTLDARQAGFGDFDVVIKGASRATIEYLEEEEALYKIKYYVTLPGDYQIDIKYDQHHIPGSPFAAKVMDPAQSEHNRSRLDSSSQGASSLESFSTLNDASEDESINNNNKLPIEAVVLSPTGRMLTGQIIKKSNGKISVKFPREEEGTYLVTMRHKKTGKLVPGSPYKVQVNMEKYDTTMVASGNGLKKACLNETNCFTIFAPDGINLNDLCVAVVGKSHLKLRVFQNASDSIDILYDIKRSGNYVFHVHEKGSDIVRSPFDVCTTKQQKQIVNNEILCTITITIWHGQDTFGRTATTELKSPTGKSMAHSIVRRGRHLLELRFLPNMNGKYYLLISFSDYSNVSQTFKINVTNYPSDEDIFRVTGDGLHSANVNNPTNVYIDSSLPVSRSFAVEFDGPDKVDIVQSRSKDGQFCVKYTTRRQGNYLMSLKYDGFHVGGSPFHISVTDDVFALEGTDTIKSNTNSCRAYGDGLSNAIAGQPNNFTVDAFNAGSGALMAGFNDNSSLTEIVCKHMGNCVYDVQYKIMEAGDHKINVLWAGLHINGSPFRIRVTDENNN